MKKTVLIALVVLMCVLASSACAIQTMDGRGLCNKCSASNQLDAAYCGMCGYRMLSNVAERTIICGVCQSAVTFYDGARYCLECGSQLPLPFGYVEGQYHTNDAEMPSSPLFYLYDINTRYYYHQLTSKEKKLYAASYDIIAQRKGGWVQPPYKTYTMDECVRVCWALQYDTPELFAYSNYANECINEDGVWSVWVVWSDIDEFLFMKYWQTVKSCLDAFESQFKPTYDDFVKETIIYDYLLDKTRYELTSGASYEAYVLGRTLCVGYSQAFVLALRWYGIQSFDLVGLNGSHAWSAVKINGEWYQADPTWDDAVPRAYTYYNLPWSLMQRTHNDLDAIPQSYKLPAFDSVKDNIASRLGVFVPAGTKSPETYVTDKLNAKKRRPANLYIQCEDQGTFDRLIKNASIDGYRLTCCNPDSWSLYFQAKGDNK